MNCTPARYVGKEYVLVGGGMDEDRVQGACFCTSALGVIMMHLEDIAIIDPAIIKVNQRDNSFLFHDGQQQNYSITPVST